MTGADFLASFAGRIAPVSIRSIGGDTKGVTLTLSDDRTITVKRALIKAAETWDDLPADVKAFANG
jgi:hypothetical protein